jgi:hypothetical protein
MVGVNALDECDSLRKDGDIALEDAFHHLAYGEFTTMHTVALQVGIDDRGLLNATVDLQTCIF